MKIKIEQSNSSRLSVLDVEKLVFGKVFSDHMFVCDYEEGSWINPVIKPYQPISLDPSVKSFHYGQSVFEGLKAYRDEEDKLWLFRPNKNIERLNRSLERLSMPEIPEDIFYQAIEKLVKIDEKWVTKGNGKSLYIRPFVFASEPSLSAAPSLKYKFMVIMSPVQNYFNSGKHSVKVKISEIYSRAANGGVGFTKASGNYAAQFYPTNLANKEGYDQVIWTNSDYTLIEESGVMNIFVRIGDKLITSKLSDRILDGITRNSILTLAESLSMETEVRDIQVKELVDAAKSGDLKEAFGTGTAAVVSPISLISYGGIDYNLPEIKGDSYSTILKNKILEIQHSSTKDQFGWKYPLS